MTIETLVPFSFVLTTIYREILSVVIKRGGRPRGLTVTTGAVSRKMSRRMIGVGRLVIVIGMATRTIRRRTCVTRSMTINTGSGLMCPHQREVGIVVVKNIVSFPGRVTGKTGRAVVRIPVHSTVFIVRFRVYMTSRTGELRIIRRIRMAFLTLIPFTLVSAAVYRKIRRIMLGV